MDWNPKVIVVGADGSEASQRAAQTASAMARSRGAELHVVTVVRPPEGWWGVVGSPPSAGSLVDAMADAQRHAIDTTMEAIDASDLEVVTAEELGDPASMLIQYCANHDADLLVIGKRGAGLAERLLVGSVADRVVHRCDLPVLVIP